MMFNTIDDRGSAGQSVSRGLRWAWPAGGLDQLLLAAACPDDDRARSALDAWLEVHDIDGVEYREHRLLATIMDRCGPALADRPVGPRLTGLQRHLWTRSRMAIAQAATALRLLADAGIPVMLLKGAARIAAEPGGSRSRLAHDVDVLTPPERFADAVDTLCDAGWTPSSGESRLCLRHRAAAIRAVNFFRDRFGDVDLHQWAYGVRRPHAGLQRDLWHHARPAEFFGVPVFVPSETDRAALAVVNSGLDAHAHSDWLVDCARLATGPLEWTRLLEILRSARAVVPAQVTFSYLAQRIGINVPGEFLDELMRDRAGGRVRRAAALLQAKPRANWSPLTRIARGVAKQVCRTLEPQPQRVGTTLRGVFLKRAAAGTVSAVAQRHRLEPVMNAEGRVRIRLEITIFLPGAPRRVEFELNSAGQHVARLRARTLRRREGPWGLRFEGEIDVPPDAGDLWLEARPAKHLRGGESEAEVRRHAILPCSVASCTVRQRRAAARAS